MKEIILIKNGELALKGLNRRGFEDVLIKNLKAAIKPCGSAEIDRAQSTITIEPQDGFDFDGALTAVGRVFGVAGYSRAGEFEKDIDFICQTAPGYLEGSLKDVSTFKVEARRSDKKFPLTSPEICSAVGSAVLSAYPHLRVDVHNPDIVVNVEIRDKKAYVHAGQLTGAGGMPVGTAGKAAVLISGGIDSPVAAYMMAKRGLKLTAVHFASPPYTSERAELKVKKLLTKVAGYSGAVKLYIVPFTEIQTEISRLCPEEYFTLIMRRQMMKIAGKIAERDGCGALITGESLGQVASQTLKAIASTDSVASLPVFRPLIGMDKGEITEISRKIDTFDISIEPYEDCCTVFTPRHPRTNPKLEAVERAESAVDFEPLLKKAFENAAFEYINGDSYLF